MNKSEVFCLLDNMAYAYPKCKQDVRNVQQLMSSVNSPNIVDVNNMYVGRRATDGGLVLGYKYEALFPAVMSVDMKSVFVVCIIEDPDQQNLTDLFLGGNLAKGTSFEQFKN